MTTKEKQKLLNSIDKICHTLTRISGDPFATIRTAGGQLGVFKRELMKIKVDDTLGLMKSLTE